MYNSNHSHAMKNIVALVFVIITFSLSSFGQGDGVFIKDNTVEGNITIEGDITINKTVIYLPGKTAELALEDIIWNLFKDEIISEEEGQILKSEITSLTSRVSTLENDKIEERFNKKIDKIFEQVTAVKKLVNERLIGDKKKSTLAQLNEAELVLTSSKRISKSIAVQEIVGENDIIHFGFNKEELIEIGVFKIIGEFSEGLAKVSRSNRFGFIDEKGNLAIPLSYSNVGNFNGGLAPAKINGSWKYIDKTGEVKIDSDFEMGYDFMGEMAPVKVKTENTYDNSYVLINRSGKITTKYFKELDAFNEYGVACLYIDSKGGYGLINSKGVMTIKGMYAPLNYLGEGNYRYKESYDKFGMFNYSGKKILKGEYEFISNYNKYGTAVALRRGTEGCALIDKDGHILRSSPKSNTFSGSDKYFTSNEFILMLGDIFPDYDLVDIRNGQLIAKNVYTISSPDPHIISWEELPEGKEMIITCKDEYKDTLFQVLVDREPNNYFSSAERGYARIDRRSSNLYLVQDGTGYTSKFGYITRTGTVIIPAQQTNLSNYDEKGYCYASDGSYSYVFNQIGTEVLRYECYEFKPISEGLIPYRTSKGWGYLNLKGDVIIEPRYEYVEGFKDGLAIVSNDEEFSTDFGLITKGGLEIFPPQLYNLNRAGTNSFEVKGTINGVRFDGIYSFDSYSGECTSSFEICTNYYKMISKQ